MAKKYYWLRLQKDFFKRHDIRIIESMPNGKDYILFYLKLLVESVSHEGELRFSETIPYNDEMLSTVTDTNIDIVRSAMKIFTELGMLEVLDDETIFMAEVDKMIGSSNENDYQRENHRLRQQRYRERLKQQKEAEMLDKRHSDVIRDVELEKELEIELEKELECRTKTKRFTPPTLEEVQDYIQEKNYNVNAEKWYSYYSSIGWKVCKNTMKDWKASVRYWASKDKPKEEKGRLDWIDDV